MSRVAPAGRLVAQCALCGSEESEEGGGSRGRARHGHTVSPHFQRRPTFSRFQRFLSSSGDKTSGAGLVPLSGIAYHIVSRTWFALYSPGRHCTHI